jgi:hypothetical protein
MSLKKHGITTDTVKNILLGAGTVYRNLTWSDTNGWDGTALAATKGGSKLTITNELMDLEIDGANVKYKGGILKTGEAAKLETNIYEITAGILKEALLGSTDTTVVTDFTKIQTKENIEDADFNDNIAFVGFTTENKPIIIIMENALWVNGLELEGKHKEGTVLKAEFECQADLEEGLDKLPVYIYYPDTALIPVTSVTLNKDSVEIAVAGTEVLTATVLPADASLNTVTWSSSDETVATVSDGTVTGVAEGECVITATAGTKTDDCNVTVVSA